MSTTCEEILHFWFGDSLESLGAVAARNESWFVQSDAFDRSIETRFDQKLHPIEASFLYLPLEHSEDLLLRDRSVELFGSLIPRAPLGLRPMFDQFLAYARRHREVIRQFGRFPHRNIVLGRRSTQEELAYLESGGETFSDANPEKGGAQLHI